MQPAALRGTLLEGAALSVKRDHCTALRATQHPIMTPTSAALFVGIDNHCTRHLAQVVEGLNLHSALVGSTSGLWLSVLLSCPLKYNIDHCTALRPCKPSCPLLKCSLS